MALATLDWMGLPSRGYRSKSWDEFAVPGAPVLDFIVTVCDAAAGEACPFWPGKAVTAHWGVPDPAAVEGGPQQREAFRDAAMTLSWRIERFLSLQLQLLDVASLQHELRQIGGRGAKA